MKALIVTLLLLTLAGTAAAQAADEAPGVAVVGKSWTREVRNPAMEEDPFRANDDHRLWVLQQKEAQRVNKIRAKQGGGDMLPPSSPTSSGIQAVGGDIVLYVYKVKFSNAGQKAIKALDWEYAFFDADTQAEVGRHTYSHRVKISPGKSAELYGISDSPRIRVVDARKAEQTKYAERVRVNRIEYADGTVWQRPVK